MAALSARTSACRRGCIGAGDLRLANRRGGSDGTGAVEVEARPVQCNAIVAIVPAFPLTVSDIYWAGPLNELSCWPVLRTTQGTEGMNAETVMASRLGAHCKAVRGLGCRISRALLLADLQAHVHAQAFVAGPAVEQVCPPPLFAALALNNPPFARAGFRLSTPGARQGSRSKCRPAKPVATDLRWASLEPPRPADARTSRLGAGARLAGQDRRSSAMFRALHGHAA